MLLNVLIVRIHHDSLIGTIQGVIANVVVTNIFVHRADIKKSGTDTLQGLVFGIDLHNGKNSNVEVRIGVKSRSGIGENNVAEQLHDGSEQFNVIILTKEIQRSLDDIAVSEDLHVLVQCTEMIEEDIDEDELLDEDAIFQNLDDDEEYIF